MRVSLDVMSDENEGACERRWWQVRTRTGLGLEG